MTIFDIRANDWSTEVEQAIQPVVVEFWHDKCVICKEMKPIFEAQPEIFGSAVKFARLNLLEAKENRVFAIQNGVRSTPTFITYCKGRPIGQIIGRREQKEFTSELKLIIDNAESCLMATPIDE